MVKCDSLGNEDYCLCTVGVLSVDRNVACDNSDVDEVTSIDIPDFGQMCRVSWSHHFVQFCNKFITGHCSIIDDFTLATQHYVVFLGLIDLVAPIPSPNLNSHLPLYGIIYLSMAQVRDGTCLKCLIRNSHTKRGKNCVRFVTTQCGSNNGNS